MEGATAAGGGGPAPFLLKTYEMVDDSSTKEIVSWSSSKNSFVVWNPPEFARVLLPTYFKHNNFSSFIRQLNTYGFRKIDPERWEFANEDFVKDQKTLLRNIHRRKPIHSHSNPQGSPVDLERASYDEEIDKLSREKAALEANVLKFKEQQSAAKLQLETLTQRVGGMEQKQEKVLAYLEKKVQDRNFVEHLTRKLESMDFSTYNKKRRLPQVDCSQSVPENSSVDNHCSPRHDSGNIFNQDFSMLRLELSPAVSDINLVSHSTQSSYGDEESPQRRISEGYPKDAQMIMDGFEFAPETLELSDTGTTSLTFTMDSSLSSRAGADESLRMHSLQQNLNSNEEDDSHISCHLNLSLASSSLQIEQNHDSSRMPQLCQDIVKSPLPRSSATVKDADIGVSLKNRSFSDDHTTMSSSQEALTNNPESATAQVRCNDVFWEQFLTERPGCSDTEEASSNFMANPYDELEERRSGHGATGNVKIVKHLSL
ncbi:heat stress transcription factor A-5-like [Cornus florida]|uniref:heat stress transcription factor A-5-like n=1 Tax=Cornus florida TaxID=4283 RepID=UPI0028A2CE70|nr:heat stress transcription factor A-5-like [Cornus florida]XP_059651023.1 heat stress transcription factor A-5-like [Cornus florida]